jgi:autotransporter-associated beta strand protein
MKRLAPIFLCLLVTIFVWQGKSTVCAVEINNIILTLAPKDTANYINYLNLKLSASTSLGDDSDTATSTITGDMLTNLRMDFTGTSRVPSITGLKFVEQTPGHLALSNTGFDLSILFGAFSEAIDTSGLKATPRTPSTFGPVNGTTIAMASQQFRFNDGSITWDGTVDGSRNMADQKLTITPPAGNDGSLVVNSRTDTWTSSTYNITMQVPLVFNEEVTSGSAAGLSYSVNISGNNVGGVSNKAGTIKATGSFTNIFTNVAGFWDTATTANLQAGSGTWSTSTAAWSVSPDGSSALLTWNTSGATTDAYFNPSGTSNITVSGTPNVNSMTINGTGYTFNSANSSSKITSTSGYINVNKDAAINAILNGTAGMTKTGSSTLTLGGSLANTYTGNTTVAAGKLVLAKTSGFAVTGNITLTNNDAYLIVQGANQFPTTSVVTFGGNPYPHMEVYGNTVYVGGLSGVGLIENTETEGSVGNGVIYVNNSANYTFNGYLRDSAGGSGTLALVKDGAGTLRIEGARTNQYTGGLTVKNGTLDHEGGTLPNCNYTITGGNLSIGGQSPSIKTFQITGGAVTGYGTFTSNATYDVQGGTVEAVLAGAVGLNKTTSTTAVLTNNNTYSSPTAISGGVLQIGNGGSTGSIAGPIALSNNSTLLLNRSSDASYNSLISGNGIIKNVGSGTTTLTHSNTYQGVTEIAAGKIAASGPGTLGTSKVLFSANNATLSVGTAGSQLNGFGGNGMGWTLNGKIDETADPVVVSNNDLLITQRTNGVRKSAFFANRVGTHDFAASFTYLKTGEADGITFTLQNDPSEASALGGGGGALGYGGIANSVSFQCALWSGWGIALNANGALGGYESMSPVELTTDNTPINFAINYVDSTNTLTVHATQGSNTYTKNYSINLNSYVGDNAYIGFTGATGGLSAEQHITNFHYSSSSINPVYNNMLEIAAGTSSATLNAQLKVLATASKPTVTMGNLKMGDYSAIHVAPETGTPSELAYKLILGSTTLVGNATFDIAKNGTGMGTLALTGSLVGAGKTVTKTGEGVLLVQGGISDALPLIDVQQGLLQFSATQNCPNLDINTYSTAGFEVLDGTHVVRDIRGTGVTSVVSGSLSARSIVQNMLVIGGAGSVAAVPEPQSLFLIFMAVSTYGLFAWKRKRVQ